MPRGLQGPGRAEKALAPPLRGFGTAVTTPTCPHCHPCSLIPAGHEPGGTWAGAPHKGIFGAFWGGSARSSDDPGGAEPFWKAPGSSLFPSVLPSEPGVTVPGRAVTKPVLLPARSQPRSLRAGAVTSPWQLPLCREQSQAPGGHEAVAGSAAVTEGTSRSSRWPRPTGLIPPSS